MSAHERRLVISRARRGACCDVRPFSTLTRHVRGQEEPYLVGPTVISWLGDNAYMKPIETVYKGYRFRSRLEARWAVFLDELGATWSFEVEGLQLHGVRYLPDFWVSSWDVWIEVKAQAPTAGERVKCRLLSRESGKRVLLIAGEPWSERDRNSYNVTLFSAQEPDRDETDGWEFGEGRRCAEEIWLVSDECGAFTLQAAAHKGDHKYPLSGSYASSIIAALTSARGARFEHGESGAA